jgi:hypothetical protein
MIGPIKPRYLKVILEFFSVALSLRELELMGFRYLNAIRLNSDEARIMLVRGWNTPNGHATYVCSEEDILVDWFQRNRFDCWIVKFGVEKVGYFLRWWGRWKVDVVGPDRQSNSTSLADFALLP